MDDEEMIRRFDAPHEAELAAAYLREQGFSARIDNDVLTAMNPLWSTALGGIRLYVPKRDASSALAALEEMEKVVISEQEETASGARADDDTARRAASAAMVGLFFCPGVFHVWALMLVSRLDVANLSAKGRRHRQVAQALSLVVLSLVVFLIARACLEAGAPEPMP